MKPRLRLGHFIHTLDDRGVASSCLSISDELVKLGADVRLICANRHPNSNVSVPDGVAVTNLDLKGRTAFGILRLASVLRSSTIDVLFTHLNGPNRAAIIARALSKAPMRIVTVEHYHYSTEPLHTGRIWRDHLTALLYPRADRVAGISPQVVEDLENLFPKIAGKTTVLPDRGPDTKRLEERTRRPDHPWFDQSEHNPLVCAVGNIIRRKGQDVLIRAVALVRRELPQVRLVLVGRFDDKAYVSELKRLVAELDMESHVWFAGYQPEPLPFIAHSNVFGHAARSEALGMVLIEAMACGVPAVATDSPGGVSFVLDDGRAGLLVPPDDQVAMAGAITRLLSDRDLRKTLIARGRDRAEMFTPSAVARAYAALAQECLAESANPVR